MTTSKVISTAETNIQMVAYLVAGVTVQLMMLPWKEPSSVELSELMTVRIAKFNISKILAIPPYQQKLTCTGKKLQDHYTLSDYKGLPDWPYLQLIKSKYVLNSK